MNEITHRRDLWKLLGLLGPGDAAEIGVAEGNFSRDILEWPIQIDKLFMVDRWRCCPGVAGDSAQPQRWHDANFARAKEQVAKFGKRAVFLRGDSVEMAKYVADGSLLFVNIDADHSYRAVSQDLLHWRPKVRRGGIIALHDFENSAYGVKQAVIDFCKFHRMTYHLLPEDKPEDAGAYIQC